jgi:DNA-binding transcriptional ArsR family regulator
MKRDMELVLKILAYFEGRDEISVINKLEISGYDDRVVSYHLRRMYEAGLLDAEAITSSTTEDRLIRVYPFGLTWEGHEFFDSMRYKTVGQKVRERLGNSLSEVPFSLIKELALTLGRSQLGL